MRYLLPRVLGVALALSPVAAGAAPVQSFNGSAVAATVNGETITVDDWIGRMQNLRYQDFVQSVSPLRAKTASAGQVALESLVNSKLVLQYAKKVGLLPSDAELDKAVEDAKKQPGIALALQNKLVTEATLREELKIQRALYNVATVNRNVTQEEVALYYASHQEQYGQPEQWRIAVIRVTSKAAADKVAAELKAGKAFEEVAAQLSEDADSKKRGGELGTFAVNDPGMPAFIREPVSKLKVGETTPVITSNVGGPTPVYFYLRLLGKKEKTLVPLEQIRPLVERTALFEKVGGGAQKLAELRKDATITVSLSGYQDLFKK